MAKNTEFGFIEQIKSLFQGLGEPATEGIGDDCAVIPVSGDESLVLTTDLLSEGVHFLCDAISAYELGRKSLAVNLSDVASMGATPISAMLSLALPKERNGEWVDEFMRGFHSLASEHDVALIGGDTSGSLSGVMINVVAIGRVKNTNIKRRSAARVGDKIYVVGELGASSEGLKDILKGDYNTALAKVHNCPRAQVSEGVYLGARAEVHAMIDLSDGLASDLVHILELSGVDALVNLDRVAYCASLQSGVCGGEDYKLLFTASSDDFLAEYKGEKIYQIGEIIAPEGEQRKITWLEGGEKVEKNWRGFTHF